MALKDCPAWVAATGIGLMVLHSVSWTVRDIRRQIQQLESQAVAPRSTWAARDLGQRRAPGLRGHRSSHRHNKARSVGPGLLSAQPWCRPKGGGRSCAVG